MPLDALDPASLAPLFRPDSIAIIGASTDPTKLGTIPLVHMKTSGFKGPLYPINPRAATVQDVPAFPSILAVPEPVDLAIIAVPEAQAIQAMRDCASKGVRAIVLFTSGFAEVSAAGARAQEEIKTIARDGGMRLLGPNCMGLVNFANGVVATFHPAFGPGLAPKGRIGLISQSGAFGGLAYQVAQDRALAYSLILTTGNEGDVDVADGIAYLAEDPETAVIMLYIEGCRDGRKLAEALRRARARRKPVICLKVGRTEAGIAAVASHTAALAGADELFEALFRQQGVYRCATMEEFFDIGYAAAQVSAPPPVGRVGIITVSGGVGVLMADSAAARGLEVTPAPQKLQDDIRAIVPFAGTRNPIDVTGQVVSDYGILERTIEMTLAEGGYDSVACFIGSIGRSPVNAPRFMAAFPRMRRRFPDTMLAVACYHTPQFRAALDAAGCLVFDEPTHALRALAALGEFRRAFDRGSAAPAPLPAPEALAQAPCDEATALAIVARAGIPVVPHRLVTSAAEAAEAATRARPARRAQDRLARHHPQDRARRRGARAGHARRRGPRLRRRHPARAPGRAAGNAHRLPGGADGDRRRRDHPRRAVGPGVRPGGDAGARRHLRRGAEGRDLPPRPLRRGRGAAHDRGAARAAGARGRARPAAGRSRGARPRAGGALALCRGPRPGAAQPRSQPLPGAARRPRRARARRGGCARLIGVSSRSVLRADGEHPAPPVYTPD